MWNVCVIQLYIEQYNSKLWPVLVGSSQISDEGNNFCLYWVLQGGKIKEYMCRDCFLSNTCEPPFRLQFYIHVPCMLCLSSLHLSSILYQFKHCNMSQILDTFCCLFWCIWKSWAFIAGVIGILNNCFIRD